MKLIADWQNKNLRCYFCGDTRSVKYEKEIFGFYDLRMHFSFVFSNRGGF